MESVSVTQKLSQGDYFRFNVYALSRKWSVRIFLGVFLVVSLWTIVQLIWMPESFQYGSLAFPFILLALPVFVLFRSKKYYHSNKMLREEVTYTFNSEKIVVAGASSRSEVAWKDIYNTSESKRFFLIWYTQTAANIILKENISDQQLNQIKSFASVV